MSNERRTAIFELAFILAAFVVINVVFGMRQQQITYMDGKGWEGVGYYAIADQMAHGQPLSAEGPYCYRLLTPWLAAHVDSANLFRGFKLVNITANAIGLVLLWCWLRRHIASPTIRVLLSLLYLIQWDAPTRWILFYPVHADPILYVTLFAGLLLVERLREKWSAPVFAGFCALTVLAVINRDVGMLPALAYLGIGNPIRCENGRFSLRFPRLTSFLPAVLGMITFVIIKRSIAQSDKFSFVGEVVRFLYEKGIASYTHAWLLAFGPVLFILIFNWRRTFAFVAANQHLLLYFITCAVFGYIGGTDTERLLFWSAPVTLVLIGRAIADNAAVLRSPLLIAAFVVGQILTSRILWTTPDYPKEFSRSFPLLQQFGSNVPFLDLFSFHGFKMKEAIGFAQFAIFGAIVLFWMWRRSLRIPATPR